MFRECNIDLSGSACRSRSRRSRTRRVAVAWRLLSLARMIPNRTASSRLCRYWEGRSALRERSHDLATCACCDSLVFCLVGNSHGSRMKAECKVVEQTPSCRGQCFTPSRMHWLVIICSYARSHSCLQSQGMELPVLARQDCFVRFACL